jgi:hypothetical protein
MTLTTYRLSSRKMTVAVDVDEQSTVRAGAPVVHKFVGQPLAHLVRWMQQQGEFEMEQVQPLPTSEDPAC